MDSVEFKVQLALFAENVMKKRKRPCRLRDCILVARVFLAAKMDIQAIQLAEEQPQILNEEYKKKLKDYNLPDPCRILNSKKIDGAKLWTPVTVLFCSVMSRL